MHISTYNGRKSAILNTIKIFFRAGPSLKAHILFHSSGLAIDHDLPDILGMLK